MKTSYQQWKHDVANGCGCLLVLMFAAMFWCLVMVIAYAVRSA